MILPVHFCIRSLFLCNPPSLSISLSDALQVNINKSEYKSKPLESPVRPPLPFLLQRFIHIVATVTFVHIPTSRESCLHSCVSVYTEEVYTYISICLAASLLQLRQGSPSRSGVACCGPLQVLFKVLFCVPPPLPHFLYLGTTIHPTPLPWPKATRSGGQVYKRERPNLKLYLRSPSANLNLRWK